jgi:hypothetical protein
MRYFRGLLLVITLAFGSVALAQTPLRDWNSCNGDLDRTQKAASDAADAAKKADSSFDDFDRCKRDPQSYDFMHDGCRSHLSDYESAVSDLESNLDNLDNRLRSVQGSCDYQFGSSDVAKAQRAQQRLDASRQRLCESFKNLIPLASRQGVFQMCVSTVGQQGEAWCRACVWGAQ